jgi:hypothetical protein
MPAVKPVILLVKEPVPVPSVVFEPDTVGLAVVAQHIPLEVMAPPPSSIIFPPETALVAVIEFSAAVVIVGTTIAPVVNETSCP